ncbi:hypothetical protein C8A01DRAFT_20066 [Parachaetomium inaequale]|uniref:2EXR domain-containing protein n=1 Tax=Parachaetomium inaequale TaxID=2588326 RepID=A0AAN6P716_9PEZI|nr:hypothetical protein C8A01DRAFT_20066 [Parachaetomium inaequale]
MARRLALAVTTPVVILILWCTLAFLYISCHSLFPVLCYTVYYLEVLVEHLEAIDLNRRGPAALPTSSPYWRPPRSTPTTFPHFARLPPGLRLLIWELALRVAQENPTPSRPWSWLWWRAALVSIDDLLFPAPSLLVKPRRRLPQQHIFTCGAPPPAQLAVNAEARAVALGRYRLGLAPDGGCRLQPRVYVDLARDVVCLTDAVMETRAGRELFRITGDVRRAKRVCVAVKDPRGVVGAAEREVLERDEMRALLEGVEELCVVESSVLGARRVSDVAGRDWGYWVGWMKREGRARWLVGGPGEG